MSYRAGIGEGLRALGLEPGPPRVMCDGAGCSALVVIEGRGGMPPRWFINGKGPPRWKTVRDAYEGRRLDFCPACRLAPGKERL